MSEPKLHVGRTFPTQTDWVDGDATAAFALSYDDPNPCYQERTAVPPVYVVTHLLRGLHEAMQGAEDPGAVKGTTGGVHAQHDIYFHNPIEIGNAIEWQASVHSYTQTPAGALVAIRFLVSDPDGKPLVEHYWTTMRINGRIEQDLGPRLAPHTFPDGARERPIGTYNYDVPFDQSFRYAGASHDHAPMHINDKHAQTAGFPSKFLQGLCTFSICSGAVVSIGADGDPARLRRLAGRFSSPVYPLNEIEVGLFDGGRTDDGNRIVAFEAESAGATVIKHGWAEVAD
jgi:acyl dehydratase